MTSSPTPIPIPAKDAENGGKASKDRVCRVGSNGARGRSLPFIVICPVTELALWSGVSQTQLVLSELTHPRGSYSLTWGQKDAFWSTIVGEGNAFHAVTKKQKKHCHPSLNGNVYFFKYVSAVRRLSLSRLMILRKSYHAWCFSFLFNLKWEFRYLPFYPKDW